MPKFSYCEAFVITVNIEFFVEVIEKSFWKANFYPFKSVNVDLKLYIFNQEKITLKYFAFKSCLFNIRTKLKVTIEWCTITIFITFEKLIWQ